MVRLPIELTTRQDIIDFVDVASSIEGDVLVRSGNYCGNGKSLLNVLASVEWSDVYVEVEVKNANKFDRFVRG